jgi:hypothetical protein
MPRPPALMLLGGLLVLGAAPACGSSGNAGGRPPNLTPQSLTVVVRDFSVSTGGVRSLRPGLTTIRFKSEGEHPHALGVWKLRNGVAYEEFLRQARRGGAEDIVSRRGGVPYLGPGGEWRMTTRLRRGAYVLLDYEPLEGIENWRRGAITRLLVRGRFDDALPPSYGYTIRMREFSFLMDQPRRVSHESVIRIVNEGKQEHDVRLLRLAEGTTVGQGLKAVRAYLAGSRSEVPGEPVDLLGLVEPGWTGYVEAALKPGRYLVLCFAFDPETGKRHTELGMTSTLTIQ